MSLFQRPVQPPAVLSDQAVERYLEAVRAELGVDPLFRRRLRGSVVNRFVAEREGVRAAPGPRRRMGALGRAVLYASFALSVSVSTVMAAAQGAVPGDALYPLKLQIEDLRLMALPDRFHDDLAAHSLVERIHELELLTDRGEWARVAGQVEAVEREYRHFVAVTRADGASDHYLVVLTALLERLPDRAQLALANVLAGVEQAAAEAALDAGPGTGGGGGGARGGADRSAATDPTPRPTLPDRAEPSRATKSARPSAVER